MKTSIFKVAGFNVTVGVVLAAFVVWFMFLKKK